MFNRSARATGEAESYLPGTGSLGSPKPRRRRGGLCSPRKLVGLAVCFVLIVAGYFIGGIVFSDEESTAQLRERIAKVYTERNALRKEVDSLTGRVQSAEAIRKTQKKRIEKLELDLEQFDHLQKKGVPKQMRQLEVDIKAQKGFNEQLKEALQACLDEQAASQ